MEFDILNISHEFSDPSKAVFPIMELKRDFPDVKIIAICGGGRNDPEGYLHLAKN